MLRIENLSKIFTIHILKDKRIEAFRGVSFELKAGYCLGISGPSGSGKSSILKCIHRTYLATSGSIVFDSEEGEIDLVSASEHRIIALRRKEIAYVSQFLKVPPRVAARDIVAEPLIRQGRPEAQSRERAESLLEQLNIPGRLHDAYPATFSGGEQQRINIARAVIQGPRLLLLDEPTASLDKDSESLVLHLFSTLKSSGTAMIVIFHDPRVLEHLSDRIYSIPPSKANPDQPEPKLEFQEFLIRSG
jgi:alpha-D-ribose 1-methylphosphonate 5-triphosphate synthase subunit PhnL